MTDQPAFILRVLTLVSDWDITDALWWKVDTEGGTLAFFINCNDLFFWACSEGELLTPANIDSFEEALRDVDAVCANGGYLYGAMLWCARMRQMRPQGAAYPAEQTLWPLLDACGPEREVGLGNPCRPGEYTSKPSWIRTADELPLHGQYVWIWHKNFGTSSRPDVPKSPEFARLTERRVNGMGWLMANNGWLWLREVSHWQMVRVPEPPREETNG